MKKKVVIMGGGNGSSVALDAIKQYADQYELSAVIAMTDSGYSAGVIRKKFGILPPGDIMKASVALSKYPLSVLKPVLFKNRISRLPKLNKDLKARRGPNLGNLFFLFISQYEGDFITALRGFEEALDTVGHAYPATIELGHIVVELTNGDIVKAEHRIDEPDYDRSLKIKRAWLEPKLVGYSDACEQIKAADYIIFSPGDLYTSVIASLLPKGIRESIDESNAKLIYAAGNAFHTHGETGPEKLSEFVEALETYLPRKLDHVVFNNAELPKEAQNKYETRGWSPILVDVTPQDDPRIVMGDYEKEGGGLDSQKLGAILHQIISS